MNETYILYLKKTLKNLKIFFSGLEQAKIFLTKLDSYFQYQNIATTIIQL